MFLNTGSKFDEVRFDRKGWKQAERLARLKLHEKSKYCSPNNIRIANIYSIDDLVHETERIFIQLQERELGEQEAHTKKDFKEKVRNLYHSIKGE